MQNTPKVHLTEEKETLLITLYAKALDSEKGIFNPTMKVVPFSAIDRIDRDKLSVYLTLPNKELRESGD